MTEPVTYHTYAITFTHNGTRHEGKAEYLGGGWWLFGTWLLMDGCYGVSVERYCDNGRDGDCRRTEAAG